MAPAAKSVGSTSTTLDHAETGRFAVVGDVDADGDDDLVALSGGAALVYLGDPAGIAATAERTLLGVFGEGAVVAALGDVNGDGYDDVAVGDRAAVGGAGRVLVYHGSARGLSRQFATALTGRATEELGAEVAGAGDVNGDGYDDLAVYIPGRTRVRVYYGSPAGIPTSGATSLSTPWHDVSAVWPNDAVTGAGLTGAGDVNGDGYDDLVVSYPTWNTEDGGFYVYLGASSGLSRAGTLVTYPWPDAKTDSDGPPYMGWALAGAGDLNADGFDDVVAGAPFDATDGFTYAFFGSATGIDPSTWAEFYAYPDVSELGATVDIGDFNGDGTGDIAFGGDIAGWAEGAFRTSSSAREVWTSVTTLAGTNDHSADRYGALYSTRVATGDVNGDGYDDLAAASYQRSGDWSLSVFYGEP